MTWQDKMDIILKEVFGNQYGLEVVNEHEINISYRDKIIMNVKTVEFLSAHWRKELKSAIMKLFDFKVAEIYKKY